MASSFRTRCTIILQPGSERQASPPALPLNALAAFGAGWQIHAEDLAAYLAGRERSDTESRWHELVPAYQDLAANIG